MISLVRECLSKTGKGGEVNSQTPQMPAWIREQERIIELASPFPTHFLMLDPGLVAMKATTTVMVLANTQEMATEKIMPKAVCRRRQVTFLGFPIKSKEQRKQKSRATRRM